MGYISYYTNFIEFRKVYLNLILNFLNLYYFERHNGACSSCAQDISHNIILMNLNLITMCL
jgi:hypothetical protein